MAEVNDILWLSKSLRIKEVLEKHKLPVLVKNEKRVTVTESFTLVEDVVLVIHGKDDLKSAFGYDEAGRAFTIPINCKHKVMLKPVNGNRIFPSIKDVCDAKRLPLFIQNRISFEAYEVGFPTGTQFVVNSKNEEEASFGLSIESLGPHPVRMMLPHSVKGDFFEIVLESERQKLYVMENLKSRVLPFSVTFVQPDHEAPPHLLPQGDFRVDEIKQYEVVYVTTTVSSADFLIAIPCISDLTVKVGQVLDADQTYLSYMDPKVESINIPLVKRLFNTCCMLGRCPFMSCNELKHLETESLFEVSTIYEKPVAARISTNLYSKDSLVQTETQERHLHRGNVTVVTSGKKENRNVAPPPPPLRVSSLKKNCRTVQKYDPNTYPKEQIDNEEKNIEESSTALYKENRIPTQQNEHQASKEKENVYPRRTASINEDLEDPQLSYDVIWQEKGSMKYTETRPIYTESNILDPQEAVAGKTTNEKSFPEHCAIAKNEIQKKSYLHDNQNHTKITDAVESQIPLIDSLEEKRLPPLPEKKTMKKQLSTESKIPLEEQRIVYAKVEKAMPPVPVKRKSLKGATSQKAPVIKDSTSKEQIHLANAELAKALPPVPAKRKISKKVKGNSLIAEVENVENADSVCKSAMPPPIKPRKKNFDEQLSFEPDGKEDSVAFKGRKESLKTIDDEEQKFGEIEQVTKGVGEKELSGDVIQAETCTEKDQKIKDCQKKSMTKILVELNLNKFEDVLASLQVDQNLMKYLKEEDLINDIGMNRFEARKLLLFVQDLSRADEAPPESNEETQSTLIDSNNAPEAWTCSDVFRKIKEEIKMTDFADFCLKEKVNGRLLMKILDKEMLDSIKVDYNVKISNIQEIKLVKFVLGSWRPE